MTPVGASPGPDSTDRPKVLLVDDDEVNLMLVHAALHQFGFDVTDATDGESALMLLGRWVPDLIVLDARMPGLDGFETCRELRRMYGFENVPVLMLTGLDDEASINRAYQVGATDFFVKSNQWSLLAGRLRYMLRSSRTTLELKRSKDKLVMAQHLAAMGSFDWHLEDEHNPLGSVSLSEQALQVLGFPIDVIVSLRDMMRLVVQKDRRQLLRSLRWMVHNTSVIDVTVTVYNAQAQTGKYRHIQVVAEPEFDEFSRCVNYGGIVQDITERRNSEKNLQRVQQYDKLTELPNRQHMRDLMDRALESARRRGQCSAMLLIDLDRFNKINDTLGHSAGDELLLEVGHRLRGCMQGADEPALDVSPMLGGSLPGAVGRIGGDEFAILLPVVSDEAEAVCMARRVMDSLREPVHAAGQEVFATASIGIALYPRDGGSVDELMRSADVAMYAAKDQGRNTSMVYHLSQSGRGLERLELETALHKALERDELLLYYQPQIDVQHNRLVGVEALMRWKRGDQIVPPASFIDTAEETGLIVPMSEWALREAARQAAIWRDAFGFSETIAVNVPARVFMRSDLLSGLCSAVEAHGLPPSTIQLEITENSLREEESRILSTLHALNDIGVQFSVDDFGTGYSNLRRMAELPIAEIKIDRSFVVDLGSGPKPAMLIATIVALARNMGLRVIAEGVETSSQVRELMSLGCHLMQGYYFSRPVPGDQLQAWAIRHLQNADMPLVADDATAALPATTPLPGVT
ncbi:MAG: histidine kinase [Burkholderiales bacterium PBB6]|nr:MAG: histidine kinase [Burkholderiales bacterium PBB6]